MNLVAINVALAFGWAALFGDFSTSMLAIGFIVGHACLWVVRPLYGDTGFFGRFWRSVGLIAYFHYDLVVSSVQVVWDVLTPTHRARPGVLAVPLDAESDVEIALTANLISLTPGTLSLDVSEDRKLLYVHAMFADDPETMKAALKNGMERRVLAVTR